jgi:hypothetical protein
MKTISKFAAFAVLAGALLFASCSGSYYVTERPAEPYYVQPAPPYYGAVWIPGEWTWSGGRYVYVHGYYTHARAGHVWVRGSWYNNGRGYVWHRGHWG